MKYRIDNLPKERADQLVANLRHTINDQIRAAEKFIAITRQVESEMFQNTTDPAIAAWWKALADGLSEYDRERLAVAKAAQQRADAILTVPPEDKEER